MTDKNVPGKRVTLQDVAEAAGVSRMSVSLALRNHPKLPEATRLRIQVIAEQMTYRPDPALSALVAYRHEAGGGRTVETLAWITNWPTQNGWREASEVYVDYFVGARQRAAELGYGLEHFWLGAEGMSRSRFEGMLEARRIRGLIVAPQPDSQTEIALRWEKYAGVKIGYTTRFPALHLVAAADYPAMITILEELRKRGYRRIGIVLNEATNARAGHHWLGAFLSDQYRFPAEVSLPPLLMPGPRKHQFQAWRTTWNPDVLITTHRLYEQVAEWCKEIGLRIPEDIGVAIVSNVKLGGDLSGIYGYPERIGAKAVDVLSGMLHLNERGLPQCLSRVLIDGTWNEGKTVRPLLRSKE